MKFNEINEALVFMGMDPINFAEVIAEFIVNGIIIGLILTLFGIIFWKIKH